PLGQTDHYAVVEHYLSAGYFRMETGAELDHRRDPPVDLDGSFRRLGDAGDQLQQRALAGSVPADDPERAPLRHGEGDVVQRREPLVGGEILDQAARQQRALQRRELLALAVG